MTPNLIHQWRKRGFTLIEMTLMIAVGSILVTSLVFAAQTHYKATIENRNYLIGFNLARRQMAIMYNTGYPAIMSETAQAVDSGFPDFIPTQEVTLIDSAGGHTLEQICIRVRLRSSTGPVLASLYTFRSDIITFGDGV
jgi:prepilin-type N-terminal cleavage/methylation domain-containing protein